MTREEEILNAAREHNSGITLSSPSNVLHFEAGAHWADKHPDLSSLWHDASEEPQGEDWKILCEDANNDHWVAGRRNGYNWEKFVKYNNIQRWAYIKDLLPKRMNNYEQRRNKICK